jgi:hypothetical protein
VYDSDRIEKAIAIACGHGYIDGDHHKAWAIDQMLRALMTKERYEEFVRTFNEEEGPGFEWSEGMPP